jgi:hypothetical protein
MHLFRMGSYLRIVSLEGKQEDEANQKEQQIVCDN